MVFGRDLHFAKYPIKIFLSNKSNDITILMGPSSTTIYSLLVLDWDVERDFEFHTVGKLSVALIRYTYYTLYTRVSLLFGL